MVELRIRKREMTGYGGNHHERLGLKRISCASQLTITDTAGTSPDPVCNTTDTRSFKPNQASRTPDSSYPLVILHIVLIIIPHLSLSRPQLYYHRRTHSWDIPLYPSMSWSWVDTKYSIHRVEHGPSTTYTENSIHGVQHTPKIVWLPFILMITSWPLNVASASSVPPYLIETPSARSPWELNCKVTVSHSHGCELTNRRFVSQHPVRRPSTASRYLSTLARLPPPSASPNSLDYGLQTRSITASRYISKLACLRPPSSHDHGLQVHISKLARSQPPCVSPNLLDYSLQVRKIMTSQCINTLAWSWPPSASPKSLDHGLRVYLWVHSIVTFRRTSKCSQAPPAASPDIPCVDGWVAI